MNRLENFIKNNRDEFDSEEMKIDWERINSGITKKTSPLKIIQKYWWAAAASIVIAISAIFYFNSNSKTENSFTAEQQPKVDLPSKELTNQIDPEYTDLMDQFAIVISVKENELKQNQKSQPELYNQFLKDHGKLDSSYNYLKSQLAANPNKEQLLNAMIENLQLKIDVLNRQLQIIKQSKHKKTNNENKTI